MFMMLSLAFAAGESSGSPLGVLWSFLPIILIFPIFYFLVIMLQQKTRKKHQAMIDNLKSGDRVVTSSGIIGTVVNVDKDAIVLNGICDRCNTTMKTGEGYAVYSESRSGISSSMEMFVSTGGTSGSEMGAMLLCEKCANSLFTEEIWTAAREMTVNIDPADPYSEMSRQARSQVINFSVAMRAKRRGLSAFQAKEEARKIAQLWWKDQEAAGQQLLAQI